MEKDTALLNYLKKLSPRFKKLVERALKEQINIISTKECQKYGLLPMRFVTFQAGHFPLLRLDKIIIISLPRLSKDIKRGNLGRAEVAFAHEIGHNLNWENVAWLDVKLPCRGINSPCQYDEIVATKIGFDILKEIYPKKNLKFLFKGKPIRAREILHQTEYLQAAIDYCESCHDWNDRMISCPKEKEIIELVEAIEKSGL